MSKKESSPYSKIQNEELEDFQRIDPSGDIFKQIFRYSIVPTIIHDLEMKILYVNDSAVEQFGYSRSEFMNMSVFELHTRSEIELSEEVLGKMEKEDKLSAETGFKRKDGSEFAAQVTPCKYIMDDKPVIHVFIQDITERKRRDNQLLQLNSALKKEVEKVQQHSRELERKNRELAQFAYVASHDLQEPLRTVTNFAELLNKKYRKKLDEKAVTYLDFIVDSTRRMRSLIRALLDYSHVGQEKKLSAVNLNNTIELVRKDLDDMISKSNASLEVDDLPVVKGYATELRLLFQNLISNAIKFQKKNHRPHIKLTVTNDDDGWIFSVKDNGIGINEEYNEKIFTIFHRLNERSQYEGTGIGLAHCRKVVDLHGGDIWVESEPGDGSTFYVRLPKL